MKQTNATRHVQRGSVLLVAMIMLLTIAMLAAAALRGSLSSAQAIGNMQWRSESVAAANDAIDRLLSSADFATKTDVVTAAVNSSPFQVDINGDTVNDIEVNFPAVTLDGVTRAGPRCLRTTPIPSTALNVEREADKPCYNGSSSDTAGLGVADAGSGGTLAMLPPPSLCSNTEWSVRVRATDAVTRTQVDIVQGVGIRIATAVASDTCK